MFAELPAQCLCCDLRVGVAVYGTLIAMGQLALIAYIYYLASTFDAKDDTYFWIFIAIASVSLLIWLLRVSFLTTGVYMGKLSGMRAYYGIVLFDLIITGLYSVRQIVILPVSIIGILIGLGIGLYHLLCVKSLYMRMRNEQQTFNKPGELCFNDS